MINIHFYDSILNKDVTFSLESWAALFSNFDRRHETFQEYAGASLHQFNNLHAKKQDYILYEDLIKILLYGLLLNKSTDPEFLNEDGNFRYRWFNSLFFNMTLNGQELCPYLPIGLDDNLDVDIRLDYTPPKNFPLLVMNKRLPLPFIGDKKTFPREEGEYSGAIFNLPGLLFLGPEMNEIVNYSQRLGIHHRGSVFDYLDVAFSRKLFQEIKENPEIFIDLINKNTGDWLSKTLAYSETVKLTISHSAAVGTVDASKCQANNTVIDNQLRLNTKVENIDDKNQMKNLFTHTGDRTKIWIDLNYRPNNFEYFLSHFSIGVNTAQCDQLLTSVVSDTFKLKDIVDKSEYENKMIRLLTLLLNQYTEKYLTMKRDATIEDFLLIDYGPWRIAKLEKLLTLLEKNTKAIIQPLKDTLRLMINTHAEISARDKKQVLSTNPISAVKLSTPSAPSTPTPSTSTPRVSLESPLPQKSISVAEEAPRDNIEEKTLMNSEALKVNKPRTVIEIPSYDKLPADFKSDLSVSSKKTRQEFGQISTEQYWQLISDEQRLELWSTFKASEMKKSTSSVFSQHSMFRPKMRFEELNTQEQQFVSEYTRDVRHQFNVSASYYFNETSQEIRNKIMDACYQNSKGQFRL